jgi:myo-inositol-1(or 4)-monophosphatase
MNCARELEITKALAAQAGAVLLQFRGEAAGEVGRKRSSGEVVSLAGVVTDDLICSGLADAFPDDTLFSRHSGRQAGWTGRVWLVDALDGDENFVAGGEEFTVSIGLAVHGRAVLGVVFNPVRKEMFAGSIRLGATLNDHPLPLQASPNESAKAIVAPRAEWQDTAMICQEHMPLIPGGSLSYTMARVAAGIDGGLVSLRANRGCSTCSGTALVEAAGACATLLDGSDIFYVSDEMIHGTGIVAAAPPRHAQLLATVRGLLGDEPFREAA